MVHTKHIVAVIALAYCLVSECNLMWQADAMAGYVQQQLPAGLFVIQRVPLICVNESH